MEELKCSKDSRRLGGMTVLRTLKREEGGKASSIDVAKSTIVMRFSA
jgi:hypothetical protein